MEILKIIILSLGSAITLFILTKLMGNRELSQLNMFDYVIGISIGSIAAEMSTSLESNFLQPLTAMIVYALVSILISIISYKSLKFRKFITGNVLVLYDNGVIHYKNLKKAKLDLNEFLMQCRSNGYFNLSDLQIAILETNGKISFLPTSLKRPTTPEDFNMSPIATKVPISLILDGQILHDNLKFLGFNENWLNKQLSMQGFSKSKEIFLGIYDENNKVVLYKKTK